MVTGRHKRAIEDHFDHALEREQALTAKGDQPFAVLLGDDLIRYVLDPAVFPVLERTPPGRGGEIQLTDAPQEMAADGTVHGVVFTGLRHDTGDKADYLRTVVRMACERPDLGPEFVAWLRGILGELDGVVPGHRDAAA
jgi:UTP--glucose-1-phosphate uridylyltransferase